jgi:HNH endonuclease
MSRSKAEELCKKWEINPTQARHRADGTWYHPLTKFPAAYLDDNGYLWFRTEAEYERSRNDFYGQEDWARPAGISTLPEYVRKEPQKFFIDQADMPVAAIDKAIRAGDLKFSDVPTSDEKVLARRRKGQARLRQLTLKNYGHRCALCDVSDDAFLVVSHVVRWADDSDARGDLSNIICLCSFHDTLFEQGYIFLTDDLEVVKKSSKSKTITLNLRLAAKFRPPLEFTPSAIYLRKHRERTGNNT